MLLGVPAFSQMQACPANINFASGDLTHWFAYTGNNESGNGDNAIKMKYDSLDDAPTGTERARAISEYQLPNTQGIQVITNNGVDRFGGFSTIPSINGYAYDYSILLGSTAVRYTPNGSTTPTAGGYIRGVSYRIKVPAGPASEPFTITYAYAMVLENGVHPTSEQPLFSATIKTQDSIIICASPKYNLPTYIGNSGDAILDTAAALKNGFAVSSFPSPNLNPYNTSGNSYLQDVWTKGWTEVTFDLSPYRGQQVSVYFEADNCIPGGHFAYAYVAVRNSCAGLQVSGDSLVCLHTISTYSVPALANAKYQWLVPDSWKIEGDSNSNVVRIESGDEDGYIIAKEQNSCASLLDTLHIKALPSPVAGRVSGDTAVCFGENMATLTLTNYSGTIAGWYASTDGSTWTPQANTSPVYIVQDLNATTRYRAVVEKGTVCKADTSLPATVAVDQKTVAGFLDPANATLCAFQPVGPVLTLSGSLGRVVNWQSSTDGLTWADFNPPDTQTVNIVNGITAVTKYRLLVKNGSCELDTSTVAAVSITPTPFPKALADPADTTICYGSVASLQAIITLGTGYSWSAQSSLQATGMGEMAYLPFPLKATAAPLDTTDYILHVSNAGCPNLLSDTFRVDVLPKIVVDAGRDTVVVANQPLQLQASSSDTSGDSFSWSPVTNLDNPDIADPIALLEINTNTIRYTVKATASNGCTGENSIDVKVFKTGPDIFVPNAFTPGGAVNTVFRPIPVGVASLQYFMVYNRFGQLMFSSTRIGQGWDGTLNGKPQDAGSFVWMVRGTDYTGRVISKKGVMVLLR
jgi:hypothetical protein